MALLDGKIALVAGVANKRSLAWAIARRLAEQGATLAFTYQGERIESSVRELAASVGSDVVHRVRRLRRRQHRQGLRPRSRSVSAGST